MSLPARLFPCIRASRHVDLDSHMPLEPCVLPVTGYCCFVVFTGALRDQENPSDLLELELQMVGNQLDVGDWDQTQVL